MKKILQILYSGLGGTGSVGFSILNASENDKSLPSKHSMVFYGIEPLVEEYKNKCKKLGVIYSYYHKKKGLDIITQLSIAKHINAIKPDVIILHSTQTIFACLISKLANKIVNL